MLRVPAGECSERTLRILRLVSGGFPPAVQESLLNTREEEVEKVPVTNIMDSLTMSDWLRDVKVLL